MDGGVPHICGLAIYAEKHPQEISNLMAYAQIVQRISDAYGDAAALTYDDKFRRWREKDPGSCPWQLKNVELYHETVFSGLDYKLKNKKQPFRAPQKHRYCYSFNDHGTCPKGRACPHPHIFQHCQGKHSKRNCTRHRQASFPTLTSVSTAKGNIPNKIVLGTDKLHSLNKTEQTVI